MTHFGLDTPVDVFYRHVDPDGTVRQMDVQSTGEPGSTTTARRSLTTLKPDGYRQAPNLWLDTFDADGVVTFMSNVRCGLVTAVTVIAVDHPHRQRILDAVGVNDTRLAESIIDKARNRDGPDPAAALG